MTHTKTLQSVLGWIVGGSVIVRAVPVLLISCLPTSVCVAYQSSAKPTSNEPPRAAEAKQEKFSELAVAWDADRGKMLQGLRRSEAFRKTLLETKVGNDLQADLIGVALEAFRANDQVPLLNRPALTGFRVTAEEFVAQISGQKTIKASTAFHEFSGRWYGVWNQQPVDHHWHDTVAAPDPSLDVGTEFPKLTELQYAWIGDGFGWNYLTQPQGSTGNVVLGFVYHLQPYQPETIRSDFPLVGFRDEGKRLIWVTPDHIFFEEVIDDTNHDPPRADKATYAITGFSYQWNRGVFTASKQGFQAIYTRSPAVRPEFRTFTIK